MNQEQVRQFALKLMAKSETVYLSTVDGAGCPHIRAMLNLRNAKQYPGFAALFAGHDDDLLVYLTTNTSSPKMEQIRANPAIAVYYCEPAEFHGLMLGGKVDIVDDPKLKETVWQDGWEMYYPSGPADPDNTLLRLLPSVAKGWHGDDKFAFSVGK